MLSLLIYLIIFALIAYLVFWLLGRLPTPEPIRTIVIVVFVVVLILWLLSMVGGLPGPHLSLR
jgi:hypothetical protein